MGRHKHLSLVRSGKLPGRKVGKQVFVRREEIDEFIDSHRSTGQEKEAEKPHDEIDRELDELGFSKRE